MWTILHAPAINVPGLRGADGMPVGLTVVGGRYTEQRVIDIAERLGVIFGHSQ